MFTKKEKVTNPELAGFDLDDVFKTSPPVGWKRPASRATMLAKMLVNEKRDETFKNVASVKVIKKQKKIRMDKEIYLEAVYNEDIAGQIFMKYLVNKKKLVIVTWNGGCLFDLNILINVTIKIVCRKSLEMLTRVNQI
jgi:hypothetical protein